MSPLSLKAKTIRFLHGVWNERDHVGTSDLLAPEVAFHGLGSGSPPRMDLRAWRDFHRQFEVAFPDIACEVEDAVEEADRVAVRFTMTGTHTGELAGLPASGRPVRFGVIAITRWADGRMEEAWHCFDQLGLLRQIGAE